VRFGRSAFEHAIDQPIGTEIFDARDAERQRDVVVAAFDSARQERLGRNPKKVAPSSTRFIGGEPMKVATNVSIGAP
jgi:hypothetical protein